MNLFRFVDSMGYKPVLMGQIKGFLNRYRNPDTQREFAEKHQQKPAMVASFADGSKLAIESAIMGNATGFVPGVRGMTGHEVPHVKELLQALSSLEDFKAGGLVDFVLGAEPHTGAFVMALQRPPREDEVHELLQVRRGAAVHVLHAVPSAAHATAAHGGAGGAVQGSDAGSARCAVCDTVSIAKRDLKAGERLDGMGGFTCYGLIDSYENCRRNDDLPIALSVDCVLKRDVAKDQPISYRDVELPEGRLCDTLRAEQTAFFSGSLRKAA